MVKQRKGNKMTVLEFANSVAIRLQQNEDFPMSAILNWFNTFKDGDKFGVFYSDLNMRESARFYCNAPDYQTAIKDIIAEMPFATELVNADINEFVVKDANSDYYRKWYIVKF